MQVFHDILTRPLGLPKPAVSMGTFDGLHLGHLEILRVLKNAARKENRSAVAVTFDPHPQRVLAPEDRAPKLLSTLEERLARFEAQGLDCIVVIPFSRELSRWTADRFLNDVAIKNLDAGHLVVGYDHAFGHDRRGKTDLLEEELAKHGILLDVVPPVKIGDGPVKSSRIRRLLSAGDIEGANALLGYAYFFSGEVVRGDGRGEKLGFPTANLRVPAEKQLPPFGIYGAWAEMDGQRYAALLHLGPRPTIGQEKASVEAHLLDFPNRKLYGQKMTVTPDIALRPVESFPDLESMVRQMEVDREQFLTYIERKENTSAS